ncbi:histone-like transcription factor and archaeal histone [Colletotrichum acutatum]
MPPNNNAIPPRKEVTGQPALPLARVKKIIGTDPDIGICSNNAAFVITLATYLAAEGHNMAKAERKPRRNVQYKDLSTAVNHHDNLEFLEDVIPKTVPYKQIKDSAAAARLNPRKADQEPKKRQSTLKTKGAGASSGNSNSNGINGSAATAALDPVTAVIHSDDPSAQLVAEARRAAGDEDVDMTG